MRALDRLNLHIRHERFARAVYPSAMQKRVASYPAPAELPEGFAEWFKGSAMVEADGSPRVFYHGTRTSFTEFKARAPVAHSGGKKKPPAWWEDPRAVAKHNMGARQRFDPAGIYFTADPILAACYGPRILVVHLHLRNPYRAESREDVGVVTKQDRERLEEMGHDGLIYGGTEVSEYVVFKPSQAWIVADYPSVDPR